MSTNKNLQTRLREIQPGFDGCVAGHALAIEAANYIDELQNADPRAGWLAQMVIDKLGGTNDLPAWVYRSAEYYATALARAEAAETKNASAYEDAAKACEPEYPDDQPLCSGWVRWKRVNDVLRQKQAAILALIPKAGT